MSRQTKQKKKRANQLNMNQCKKTYRFIDTSTLHRQKNIFHIWLKFLVVFIWGPIILTPPNPATWKELTRHRFRTARGTGACGDGQVD